MLTTIQDEGECTNKAPRNEVILEMGKDNHDGKIAISEKTALKEGQSPTKKQSEGTNKDADSTSKDKKEERATISFIQMLRFATKTDWVLMVIGTIASMANGVAFPMFALIFGNMTDSFGPKSTGDELVDAAGDQALYFFLIGVGSFLLSWIQLGCWMISGERQSIKYRQEYFKAIINQEIGWFDQINANELASKIASESSQVQGALGEKVPTYFMSICMTIGGFAVGYCRGWQMALVSTAALPVLIVGAIAYTFVIQQSQRKIAGSYSTAGGLAEQALNAVKTVKSLTGETFELANYSVGLVAAFKTACRYGALAGAGVGLTMLTMFSDYALSFWYGSTLIKDKVTNQIVDRPYSQGDVFVVFTAILIGGFSIAQISPCLKNFEIGKQAAEKIFSVIDRKPLIVMPENPQKISNIQGLIEFKDVEFNYPAKPDIHVHRKLTLTIKPNQKTALVGESGCGKSTVMQLLLRFYDPNNGKISIDGQDLLTLDYRWLRSSVGYVGQEPVLFATSIRENLKFGRESATEQEMIEALKQANAWEFVKDLEDGIDTFVGNAGSQISGGQKQRICIARAILKNPQILLLDEATSALDRQNEALIQKTLDEISKGRTTIIIAHRLSTIQNADEILVIDEGKLVEQGTYQELINKKGKFETLAKNQIQTEKEDADAKHSPIHGRQHHNEKENHDNNDIPVVPQGVSNRKISLAHSSSKHLTREQQEKIEEENERKLLAAKKAELEKHDQKLIKRLFEMNKAEKKTFYSGFIFTLANGVCFPISGLVLGEFIDVLSKPDDPDFTSKAGMLSIYFVIIGAAAQVLSIFQMGLFTRVGESLTLRIRQELLKKMLKMPGGWFDKSENNPGTLSARLATDAHLINSLVSNIISVQISNISSLISGLTIAFIMSWRVALVAVASCPLIVIAGAIQAQQMEGFSQGTDVAYKHSGSIVMEAVTNIRTVASFANENKLSELLAQTLKKPFQLAFKKGHISGIAFGFSQLATFSVYSIIFICSALFVRAYGISAKGMFVAIFTILNAAAAVGNNNHFMGDVGAAKNACREIFKIIDSDDEVQIQSAKRGIEAGPLIKKRALGDIQFKNVSFKYPTRDAMVFKNLSFHIKAGQKVAFVGSSGSGKSSILQLLLRFYDDYEGEILVDGEDVRNYDLQEYRQSFGVVSQEPTLFNGTIQDNIKYNTPGVSFDDIRNAAMKANALSFIEESADDSVVNQQTKDNGFLKMVGLKGSQISGGQKQRIAIARAIIKNPNILLLDEATSALDIENEKIVQEALNKLMENKTSLCVAHRISTIKDSDQIFVIESGQLVEQGDYDQLMANKAYFYRLNAN